MGTAPQIWAYPARVTEHRPGDWVVTFEDLPEALAGGSTRTDALREAEDVLEEAVLAYLARGMDVPSPRPAAKNEELVVLDVVTAARAALSRAMKSHGITNAALARASRRSEGAIRRLIDGTTGVKIDTVLEALNSLASLFDTESPRPALAFVA